MPRTCLGIAALVCLAWITAGAQAAGAEPTNWVPNPSFERSAKGQPQAWRTEKWGGQGQFQYAEPGRTGKRCVMISSDTGADIGWACTVPIEPYARYRLSGWIKTENVQAKGGRGALLNLHNLQPVATRALVGTNDWTRVEVEFEADDLDAVQVNCLFGGWGLATGKAWYDDIAIEQISKPVPPQPRIALDATKSGQPISPLIYGQFIEHLGRCIYGGIWAEMLEDRKFFYPVGSKESPWQVVGPAEAVTMAREGAFVGEHSPQVALATDQSRGIAQGGLGVLPGKKYVGRIWLAASGQAQVTVTLIWGKEASARQARSIERVPQSFTEFPLEFRSGGRTDDARLEVTATGQGHLRIGTLSLMPADNVQGMRADTLALLQKLDSPIYRWPGGNFVSGYDWRVAIGPRDRRPPRKNPAWQGIEHNDFGLDEFIVFCRYLKTEPYITVNSGLGDVQMAVEEVQYANGGPETPMGRLRAKNGHPEPYRVKYWSIGNEMYGSWQLGHMPLEKYVKKHNEFAQAMRKVDPSICLVAVGDVGRWSEGMLRHCADHMDLISEHFYRGQRPGLLAHVRQMPEAVRQKAEAHRRYRQQIPQLKGKDIRIALDEWNYWYGGHEFGELGTRYFLKDALGIAAGLHELARQSDMFAMANYAQTVNVIGCIKTSKTAAAFETTGLVLALYRKHFGSIPVATECSRGLDAMAAFTPDRKKLTLGVVNATLRSAEIPVEVKGVQLSGRGKRYQIAGDDPMAHNDPADPHRVRIEESDVADLGTKIAVPPCSVTLLVLDVK